MKINPKKVEDRKFARENAQEVLELIELAISLRSPIHNITDFREAFWEEIRKAYPDELAKPSPTSPEQRPLSEEEAIRFEYEEVPRGEYVGGPVFKVPMGYWHWWAEHKDPFTEKLRRYLLSDRAKKRTREET